MPSFRVLEQKIPFKDFSLNPKIFRVNIAVAGVTSQIRSNKKEVIDNLKTNFVSMLSKNNPDFTLDVLVDKNLVARVPTILSIKAKKTKKELILEFNDFKGKIDLIKKHGKVVVLNSSIGLAGSFLAIMYTILIPLHDGFFLHSSAFVKNEKGFVFFGNSGAGKSTIANANKKNALLIGEEINLVKKHKKEFRLYKYPFTELKKDYSRFTTIDSFYTIKKNSKTFLKKIDEADFVSALLGSIMCVSPTTEISFKLIDIASSIYQYLDCAEFNFSKEKPFLEGIKFA